MSETGSTKEDRIRHQAYLIWLEKGRPDEKDREHWEQAEKTVNHMDELAAQDESGSTSAVGPIPGP